LPKEVTIMTHSRVVALAVCLAVLIGCVAAAVAAETRRQGPCSSRFEYCLAFQAGGEIPIIRTFRVNAPRAGTAAVTFHGALACGKITEDTGDRFLEMVTQIVTAADAVPAVTGAGALPVFMVLKDSEANSVRPSQTFNLASTRVFTIQAPGSHTYYFKIAATRMDDGTACAVYNGAFTVLFAP
jgi:hypothetical protein